MSVATVKTSPLAAALAGALAKDKRIRAWQLRSTRRAGLQTYLVKTALESERHTESDSHVATVFVANGEKLGSASVTLGPGDEAVVARRVDEAVFMAGLGGDAPWELPVAAKLPEVEEFDPALGDARARETSRGLVDAWRSAATSIASVRPSSMELFCGEEWQTLVNSAGLEAQSHATRVSLLTLLLASGEKAAERISWEERRRAADLDVKAIVGRVAEEARDLTRATLPPSGTYPVLIDAREIGALLTPVQVNASADSLWQKSSRFEVGKALPIEEKGGEPLTVISNATAPYGLSSYPFDGTGVPGQRVVLVKDGVFVSPWAGKQTADYLKTSATGTFANWELPAGKTPLAELLSGDGPVLYVRKFSWLTPDAGRGNFGSEVRMGYLYEKGAKRPVKGGTVSGNVFAALGTARWSKETAFLGDYLGPEAVRFENLTVAGA